MAGFKGVSKWMENDVMTIFFENVIGHSESQSYYPELSSATQLKHVGLSTDLPVG